MKRPNTQKEVRRFVGMVNVYRDLCPKRAATLAPLTDLCGHKKHFIWKDEQEQAFLKIKDLMAQDAMLTYPQFNKPFVVYADASERRLVALKCKKTNPSAFLARSSLTLNAIIQ